MTIKDILGLATGSTGLAILGGYVGYKYGDKVSIKNKYVGAGAGAATGLLVAQILGKFFGGSSQAQLQAQQAAQLQAQEQAQAAGDYVDFEAPEGYTPPPQPLALPGRIQQVQPVQQQPQMHIRTSPANVHEGNGSYSGTSYDVSDVEAAVSEAEDLLAYKQRRGN